MQLVFSFSGCFYIERIEEEATTKASRAQGLSPGLQGFVFSARLREHSVCLANDNDNDNDNNGQVFCLCHYPCESMCACLCLVNCISRTISLN